VLAWADMLQERFRAKKAERKQRSQAWLHD
jgi:hypothetical protein